MIGCVNLKKKYSDIYKKLVTAYYNSEFEETLDYILNHEFEDRRHGEEVLAALCGMKVNSTKEPSTFAYNIVEAITQNRVREKIVQKLRSCNKDCENIRGVSKCQSICPFNAIFKAENTEEKFI